MLALQLQKEASHKVVSVINLQIKKRIKCLFSKGNSDSSNMLNSSWKGLVWCITHAVTYPALNYKVDTITIISSWSGQLSVYATREEGSLKEEVGELW